MNTEILNQAKRYTTHHYLWSPHLAALALDVLYLVLLSLVHLLLLLLVPAPLLPRPLPLLVPLVPVLGAVAALHAVPLPLPPSLALVAWLGRPLAVRAHVHLHVVAACGRRGPGPVHWQALVSGSRRRGAVNTVRNQGLTWLLLVMLLLSRLCMLLLLLLLSLTFPLFTPLFLFPVSVLPFTMLSFTLSPFSFFRLGRLIRQLLLLLLLVLRVLVLVMALVTPSDLHLTALRPLPGISVAGVTSVT